MPDYSDVQKAVNTEKRRVWFAWLAASLLILFIGNALTMIGPVVSVIVKVLFTLLFLALTVTAYRMHTALNRRADRERRTVLGDDYPG